MPFRHRWAYIQESHIRTARALRQRGRHIQSWVGTAFDIPGHVDLDILESTLQLWTRRQMMSYVDARTVPGADRWAAWNASTLIRVSHGDQVCVWVTRIHEGLQVACRYPDTDIAYKNILRFVEELRKIIISVARTGEYGEYEDGAPLLEHVEPGQPLATIVPERVTDLTRHREAHPGDRDPLPGGIVAEAERIGA